MSEEEAKTTEEEPKIPDVKCEEGPPQIVPSAAYPMPVKVATGSMPPLQFSYAPMRPVMAYDKGGCGRHVFRKDVDPESPKVCGNCDHGTFITPRKEEPNHPNLIKV